MKQIYVYMKNKVITMENTSKTKISSFEFAIMQIADPKGAENFIPYTKQEEIQKRINDLKNQASKIKTV